MSTNMLPIANPKKENAVRVNMTYRFERGSISNIFMPTIQAMIASIEKKINLRILILTLMPVSYTHLTLPTNREV